MEEFLSETYIKQEEIFLIELRLREIVLITKSPMLGYIHSSICYSLRSLRRREEFRLQHFLQIIKGFPMFCKK